MQADPASAKSVLLREVDQGGGVEALVALGKFYREAPVPYRDFGKAVAAYQKAVDQDTPWAAIPLAEMLFKGEGVAADPDRALALLDGAEKAGLVGPAQKTLGDHYRTTGEPAKAVAAYQKAVDQDTPWAAIPLAEMLFKGEGVAADPDRALALLHRAQQIPSLKASVAVSLGYYFLGTGNTKKAIAEFESGSALGEPWAKLGLATTLVHIGETGRARQLLEQLRDLSFVPAYSSLIGLVAGNYADIKNMELAVALLDEAFKKDRTVGLQAFDGLPANAKAAAIQVALKASRLYDGPVNGLLTKKTLVSIANFCRSAAIEKKCQLEAMPKSLLQALLMHSTAAKS